MMLPTLLQRTSTSSSASCLYYMRGSSRAWSSLTGSRFVSSPLDDKENASVISDLLIHERRRQLKSVGKNNSDLKIKNNSDLKIKNNSDLKIENNSDLKIENNSDLKIENNSDLKIKNNSVPCKLSNNSRRSSASNGVVSDDEKKIIDLMKAIRVKNLCYIVGQDAADTLVKHVKKDLREGDVIAEANLGPGILTKTLLDQTTHKIIGYEPNTEFLMHLRSELQNHASRLELHCLDLLRFYWYYAMNKREPDREEEADKLAQLLQPLPVKGNREVSPVKIVTSLSEMSCFHKLTLSYTFQCCFFEEIFPVLYVYIPEHVYRHLTSTSRNIITRRLTIPFKYYFNIEHLDSAPHSSFYSQYFRKRKYQSKETGDFHLIKITPKGNVHEIVPKHELPTFHYFMRCMNSAKSGESLIFHMEKWIPGCGIDYIKNGFRMFTHPRQVSPEQLLEAYNLFKSLPAFKECMFHQFCNNWEVQFGLKDDETSHKAETGDMSDKEIEILDDDEEFVEVGGRRSWREKTV